MTGLAGRRAAFGPRGGRHRGGQRAALPHGSSRWWFARAVVLRDLDAAAVVTRVHFDSRGMHDQTNRLLEQHVWPLLRCR